MSQPYFCKIICRSFGFQNMYRRKWAWHWNKKLSVKRIFPLSFLKSCNGIVDDQFVWVQGVGAWPAEGRRISPSSVSSRRRTTASARPPTPRTEVSQILVYYSILRRISYRKVCGEISKWITWIIPEFGTISHSSAVCVLIDSFQC